MNKLELMEQISQKISNKCAEHDFCKDCILHKYNCDKNETWRENYSGKENYKKLLDADVNYLK